MGARGVSFVLRATICCGSFLILSAISRADTLSGTVGTTPIYASIPVIAGDNLHVTVTSPNLGSGDTTDAELFDGNGNLVAVAAGNGSNGSSVIDFMPPSSGDWTAGVANLASASYQFNLSITGYTGLGMPVLEQFFGGEILPPATESVTIPSNVGDTLHLDLADLSTTVPSDVLLFDPMGNLVAVASGNATDGLSSLIDFTIPSGYAGNWVAEAADLNSTPYNYNLGVYGETAGMAYAQTTTTTTTPEPASLTMLLLGLSGCGLLLRGFQR
jgi:hypothetical protein